MGKFYGDDMFKKLFNSKENQELTDEAKQFLVLLEQKNINMEYTIADDGNVVFTSSERLKGPVVKLVIVFSPDGVLSSIYLFNYLEVNSETDMFALYEHMNEVCSQYMFTCFYVKDGSVNMQYFVDIDVAYNPQMILNVVGTMINVAETAYPEFMKIIWK